MSTEEEEDGGSIAKQWITPEKVSHQMACASLDCNTTACTVVVRRGDSSEMEVWWQCKHAHNMHITFQAKGTLRQKGEISKRRSLEKVWRVERSTGMWK